MSATPSTVFDAQCPKCAHIAKFPVAALGKIARCPNCGREFQLPARASISTRVKALAATKEQKVVVSLFVTALAAFLVMFIVFLKRGTGPSLTGHYVAYAFIAVGCFTAQRLREMTRIAKTDGQKIMTRFGLPFLLLTIVCLGLAGKSHYRIWSETRELTRERTPDEEAAEIRQALADAEGGKRYVSEQRRANLFTEEDRDILRANIMTWNTKNHTPFAKRLAMARAGAAGFRRIVSGTSDDVLATYDPAKKDAPDCGIEIIARQN